MTLQEQRVIEQFRKAAKAYNKKALRSQKSAAKALSDSGIYTKTGKLTKHYTSTSDGETK